MARLLCMYGATYPAEATLDPRVRPPWSGWPRPPAWTSSGSTRTMTCRSTPTSWKSAGGHGEDIIVVEQDKEPFPGQLEAMIGCPEPWCAYTFWINPEPHTALVLGGFGVTRFSAQIQRLVPVGAFRGETQVHIDRRFYDLLMAEHGYGCHLHGHVVHHHVYEPRPLAVRQYVAQLRQQGLIPPSVAPPAPAPGLLPGSYRLE